MMDWWCDDILEPTWQITSELTGYSWADNQANKLTWADSKLGKEQLSWQLTSPLQPSWQVAAELTDYSSASTLQLRWQVSSELTGRSWADMLQLRWQLKWHVAAGLTSCSWADINSSKSQGSNGTENDRIQKLSLSHILRTSFVVREPRKKFCGCWSLRPTP